jgi:gamma-glutamyl:cysteine ligase YbdK (ATP-grasp superfamily)
MTTPSFNLGIEEEYQTVDPVTRDLRSHIDTEIISEGKKLMKEAVKSEIAAPSDGRTRQQEQSAPGSRRHASFRRLAQAGHHA